MKRYRKKKKQLPRSVFHTHTISILNSIQLKLTFVKCTHQNIAPGFD